jgi:hypothetical protein
MFRNMFHGTHPTPQNSRSEAFRKFGTCSKNLGTAHCVLFLAFQKLFRECSGVPACSEPFRSLERLFRSLFLECSKAVLKSTKEEL